MTMRLNKYAADRAIGLGLAPKRQSAATIAKAKREVLVQSLLDIAKALGTQAPPKGSKSTTSLGDLLRRATAPVTDIRKVRGRT
jgi:hypothetical protein